MIKSYGARPFTKFIVLTHLITIPPWGYGNAEKKKKKRGHNGQLDF
jgi:hypothetical protein